ncbi:unnamed protein product [Pleuronectes platessa]|uniref:Uncharacterized protein n=1 Tax=Pleuronectes platessa TaxID=8262 RepID=A0A9N7U898_PLEPL|nr:unnamed protein product [Pleuronectes platessa]
MSAAPDNRGGGAKFGWKERDDTQQSIAVRPTETQLLPFVSPWTARHSSLRCAAVQWQRSTSHSHNSELPASRTVNRVEDVDMNQSDILVTPDHALRGARLQTHRRERKIIIGMTERERR